MTSRPDVDRLMETAGDVLSRAWGSDVTLYLQDPIRSEWGRHTLLLCHVDGPTSAPAMVVVKAAVETNGAIFNEWATLEWLNGIEAVAPLVPALCAGDEASQLIVIEDLGGGPTLHRVLQTRPAWAIESLMEAQRLLGAIHVATRGRETELLEVRARLPGGTPPPALPVGVEDLRAELEAWGELSSEVGIDLETVAATLDVPASFRVLTFNDQCSVNRIITAAGVRAVDLEMAGFRHPMIDGAFASLGHLRCMARRLRDDDGMVIPPEVRPPVTDAYRAAVIDGFPEYEDDDRFSGDLTAAAAVWMVEILRRARPRVRGDKPEGFFGVTACQRVLATLAAFSELASSTGRLTALALWADEVSARLEVEWPSFPPLPLAAALRPDGPAGPQ